MQIAKAPWSDSSSAPTVMSPYVRIALLHILKRTSSAWRMRMTKRKSEFVLGFALDVVAHGVSKTRPQV